MLFIIHRRESTLGIETGPFVLDDIPEVIETRHILSWWKDGVLSTRGFVGGGMKFWRELILGI